MALELRQQLKLSQQLVMTPQLQQAIKLLQLSRMELIDLVQQELEFIGVHAVTLLPPCRALETMQLEVFGALHGEFFVLGLFAGGGAGAH